MKCIAPFRLLLSSCAAAIVTGSLLILPQLARADVVYHCVSDSSQLADVLATTSADGNTDFVLLAAGTYASPPGGFAATVQGAGDSLVIAGGFEIEGGNCYGPARPDPRISVIDGAGVNPGLAIHGAQGGGLILVQNVTFANGHRDQAPLQVGGGLAIDNDQYYYAGNIQVERVIFRDNVASGYGGALSIDISSTAGVTVRNCLFAGNQAINGAAISMSDDIANQYLIANTMTNNTATNAGSLEATVQRLGDGIGAKISDNILWGNAVGSQMDMIVYLNDSLSSNDIEHLSGTPAVVPGSVNLSVDPGFRTIADFHLQPDSPLVDAGYVAPAGGISTEDLDGVPRLLDGKLDIGAFGHDVLFIDGWE